MKLHKLRPHQPSARGFPPVNSGGLIEAQAPAQFPRGARHFPPVNSGGLIEARGNLREPFIRSMGTFRR